MLMTKIISTAVSEKLVKSLSSGQVYETIKELDSTLQRYTNWAQICGAVSSANHVSKFLSQSLLFRIMPTISETYNQSSSHQKPNTIVKQIIELELVIKQAQFVLTILEKGASDTDSIYSSFPELRNEERWHSLIAMPNDEFPIIILQHNKAESDQIIEGMFSKEIKRPKLYRDKTLSRIKQDLHNAVKFIANNISIDPVTLDRLEQPIKKDKKNIIRLQRPSRELLEKLENLALRL